MNKVFSIFAILLLTSVFMFQSCKKDVEGCTDKDADNYNSEATVSTTCNFARDKFIGNYTGSLTCPVLTAISGTTTFTIDENISGGKNDVSILITTNTGLVVPVTGTCEGNVLSINTSLQGVTITIPNLGPVLADIVAIGNATYNDSTKKLEGPLNITVTVFGSPLPTDACVFSGTKQ